MPQQSCSKCCGFSEEGQASARGLRGGAPEEVVLLLGLEGSWGRQAEDRGKVYPGKTTHAPGTEFSCGWSCSNSKKAFYASDGA